MSLQYRGRVPRTSSAICCARLENRASFATNGTALKQADFSAITYSVFNTATGTAVSSNGLTYSNLPLTISSVIFDTLQNWAEDSQGCNFIYTVGPNAFPQGNAEYQVEVKFVLTDGRQVFALFDVTTEQVWTS